MKILVMDDSVTARALFKACFVDKPNCEIIEAKQADEAIQKVKENHPELIVLDYNMPEITGSDVAKQMIESGINAHFVLLTANTQQSVIDEAKAVGFTEILEKPVSPESITLLLERLK